MRVIYVTSFRQKKQKKDIEKRKLFDLYRINMYDDINLPNIGKHAKIFSALPCSLSLVYYYRMYVVFECGNSRSGGSHTLRCSRGVAPR